MFKMMSEYNGEDLFSVLGDLHVEIGSLNPNVIRAWFDTDCPDMKKLLNWMCSSLSSENYLSAQEYTEYQELVTPLVGDKYEREVKKIEESYPNLFDVCANKFDNELAEDEVHILNEEERHLDELIDMTKCLGEDLLKEFSQVTNEEINSSLKYKQAQEHCNKLAEHLDEVNCKLQQQILKYGSFLYNFEFGEDPQFINNMRTDEFYDGFENAAVFINTILRNEYALTGNSGTDGRTYLDITFANESLLNSLSVARDRIFHSRQNYLAHKIEEEKLNSIYDYLNKFNTDATFPAMEGIYLETNIQTKEEQKQLMFGMLENISLKIADYNICQPRLRYAQKELQIFQSKLDGLTSISKGLVKILCHYLIISMVYNQEKSDITSSYQFFKKTVDYITKDLQNCHFRTEKMQKIIDDYKEYNVKPVSEKYKLIQHIVGILGGQKNTSLNTAFEIVSEFKNELKALQKQLFCKEFAEQRNIIKDLENNVFILNKFLVCGPTSRIILVPPQLHYVVFNLEKSLKEQRACVKSALEISSTMKKESSKKWQHYRRQLWVNFITDPEKLQLLLQQAEENFNRQQKNAKL